MEPQLARMLDLPLSVEARLKGPTLRIRDLLSLTAGTVISTSTPAGESVDISAGDAYIGSGALDVMSGRTIVRMVKFQE